MIKEQPKMKPTIMFLEPDEPRKSYSSTKP